MITSSSDRQRRTVSSGCVCVPSMNPVSALNDATDSNTDATNSNTDENKPGSAPFGPVMLDVVGTTLTDDDIRRIRDPLTGGVILFARNYKDRAQLTALTA